MGVGAGFLVHKFIVKFRIQPHADFAFPCSKYETHITRPMLAILYRLPKMAEIY